MEAFKHFVHKHGSEEGLGLAAAPLWDALILDTALLTPTCIDLKPDSDDVSWRRGEGVCAFSRKDRKRNSLWFSEKALGQWTMPRTSSVE